MTSPADLLQRQQALDASRSFICEAPAGSGKTELLTQRFLTLLALVERPEQVLAITFTRKAVAEMRERIVSALHAAQHPQPEEPHKQHTWQLANNVLRTDQDRGWQLLNNPNRLQIKTFDSLCSALTNALPMESALGAKPQVAEDADPLYRQAVQALLTTLEQDVPWSRSLMVLLTQLDNKYSRLEDLLVNLLSQREQWLPLLGFDHDQQQIRGILEQHLNQVIKDSLTRVRELIPYGLHAELVELAGFAAANLTRINSRSPIRNCLDIDLDNSDLPGTQAADVPIWIGIVNMLTTVSGNFRMKVDKRAGFPPGENASETQVFRQQKQRLLAAIEQLQIVPELKELFQDIRHLPGAEFDEQQWVLLNALSELLPVLSAQLLVQFQENNSVDFTEFSIRARQALGELDSPTDLTLKLDYRIQHILVDEFQDTSASQIELLNQLTSGWQADDGRTLFCVGDAMQSIYGFRGANVGLFLHCKEHGLNTVDMTPLRLTTNFRSQAGVVDWINKVFEPAFPATNNVTTGAVAYSPSEPFHEKSKGRAVWVHGFVDRQDNYDEARTVLGIVRKTRTDQPNAKIAILVRNRNHASHILPLLQEANVRYRAMDLEPLQDHAVIQDLLALTQALLQPANRTAWLAILRAPWCGLSLVDLAAISNLKDKQKLPTVLTQIELLLSREETVQPGQNDFFVTEGFVDGDVSGQNLSPDGLLRIQRVYPILKQAYENRDRKSFRNWIEGTWLAIGGAACLEDAAALDNAAKFFSLLENWTYASDLPNQKTLNQAVQKLFAAPDPLADDALQIMTIHKSKGLEFDVVIVPALHRAPRRSDSSLLMWHERLNQDGHPELIMAPLTAVGKAKHKTYQHLQSEQTKKDRLEACRLLYVACTRAKQQLHLLTHVKQDPANTVQLKKPPKSSLLNSIWNPVQNRIRRYDPKPETVSDHKKDTTDTAAFEPRPLHRLTRQWQAPEFVEGHLLDDYIPPYDFDSEDNELELKWQNPAPRHTGTLIHQYLQIMAESGIDTWNPERIDQLKSRFKLALKMLGTPATSIETSTSKIITALKRVLMDKVAVGFLSNHFPFHACEYPVTVDSKLGCQNLQIDRVFTTQKGITWVVDYKSSEPDANQSLEEFLNQEKLTYQPQLSRYQYAMAKAGFKNIKTALYFPLLSEWLVV